MYLDYYHLSKDPFQVTPDPEFLFLSPSHKEALASVIYGVMHRKGFIAITGEVGVGKTTILRSYLDSIDSQLVKVIYVFDSNMPFASLLNTLCREFDMVGSHDPHQMLEQLYYRLIEEYREGRNVALIIDEAQNMRSETLESLRILTNLETSKEKLLQVILVGQPELDRVLAKTELRQLRQRIAIRSTIAPLTHKECEGYIEHRLAVAGSTARSIFTKRALSRIIRQSKGIPRSINILCDNALITAFGSQCKVVSSRVVGEVLADLYGQHYWRRNLLSWGKALLLLAVSVLFVMWRPLRLGTGDMWPATPVVGVPAVSQTLEPDPAAQQRSIEEILDNQKRDSQESSALEKPATIQPVTLPAVAEPEIASPEPTGADAIPAMQPTEEAYAYIDPNYLYPVHEVSTHGNASNYVIIEVKQRDSLLKLIEQVYGYSDKKLVDAVKQRNPHIRNIDRILAGDRITFPLENGQTHPHE